MRITFRIVRIGEMFTLNNNLYVKQSTRTAKMVSTARTFYIGQLETCMV